MLKTLLWILKSFALALLGLPVTLLGLVLVPLGLLFRREYPETRKPFTQFPGEWMLVRLPSWLLPWDNIYDGFRGDKRGWWDNNQGGKSASLKSMFLWGAIRNPANYWSRHITGLDISKCVVTKRAGNCDLPDEEPGHRQWVHLVATRADGKTFNRFYMSWALPWDDTHGIMIDIGWKFKLAHNGMSPDAPDKDKIRGSVFTLSPYKALT